MVHYLTVDMRPMIMPYTPYSILGIALARCGYLLADRAVLRIDGRLNGWDSWIGDVVADTPSVELEVA